MAFNISVGGPRLLKPPIAELCLTWDPGVLAAFSMLVIATGPYGSVLNTWQEGTCAATAHLLAVQPLVLLRSSAVKCFRPTNMCFSSAAKEAGAERVKLDELIGLIKNPQTRETQLPAEYIHPASLWEDSN